MLHHSGTFQGPRAEDVFVYDVSDIEVLVGAEVKTKLEVEASVDAAIRSIVDFELGECRSYIMLSDPSHATQIVAKLHKR